VAISPLKDALGGAIGVSSIFRDITPLKRAQETLLRENREKDQFLAVLSHELRNPLAPMRTSLEILRRQPEAARPELRQTVQVMDRQLSQLTALVDQLLDAARLSSGKIVLDWKNVDVVSLVRSVLDDHAKLLAAAGLRLEATFPEPERQLVVGGDRLRLAQSVGNLLTNSVKFTPRGGLIRVSVEADAKGRTVSVTVADSGVGIEPGAEESLFKPFAQARTGLAPSKAGLGLGLAVVRGLAESHGGTVRAHSEGLGKGAAFTITLPLLGPEVRAAVAEEGEADPGAERVARRILVVEDNQDAADSLRRLLELWGHEVESVPDGHQALESARAMNPEVVICDLRLEGDMDGWALARALRAERRDGRPLMLAMTGFGQPGDRERSFAAGFDRHMTKPPDVNLLRRLIDGVQAPSED